jgi:hypothetical protein
MQPQALFVEGFSLPNLLRDSSHKQKAPEAQEAQEAQEDTLIMTDIAAYMTAECAYQAASRDCDERFAEHDRYDRRIGRAKQRICEAADLVLWLSDDPAGLSRRLCEKGG